MAKEDCCNTCRKKEGCPHVCSFVSRDICPSDCRACTDYEKISVPASSKPRIVAV